MTTSPSGSTKLLRIYLNDHRALLVGEASMARRSRDANVSSPLGAMLDTIVDQVEVDRATLDDLLRLIGGRANPLKQLLAVAGERLGRFKLNGRLRGYSPLSRLIEIEALLATTATRRAMWSVIAALSFDHDVTTDASIRAGLAEEQHRSLTEHHLREAPTALADGTSLGR